MQCGDQEQLLMLLNRINSLQVRAHAQILEKLMRLVPFLAFGDQEKMLALVRYFKQCFDFEK